MSEHYVISQAKKQMERELHPQGMSVHDGKMKMDISHVQWMVSAVEKLQAENATLRADAECMAEQALYAHQDQTATDYYIKTHPCTCYTCKTARKYTKGE